MTANTNATWIFGATIAAVTAAYYLFRLNAILAFWLAYILTRPLGASFGGLLSQPAAHGGMGWVTSGTSAVFLSAILGLVVVLARSQKRVSA